MHRPLLMTHKNVANVILLKDLVIDGQNRATWIPEHRINALFDQGFDHHLCTGHLTRHLSLSFVLHFGRYTGRCFMGCCE